jgi:hypothetical protein
MITLRLMLILREAFISVTATRVNKKFPGDHGGSHGAADNQICFVASVLHSHFHVGERTEDV